MLSYIKPNRNVAYTIHLFESSEDNEKSLALDYARPVVFSYDYSRPIACERDVLDSLVEDVVDNICSAVLGTETSYCLKLISFCEVCLGKKY